VRTRAAKARLTWDGLHQEYVESLRARHLSRASLTQARTLLPPFIAHMRSRGVIDPRRVTDADVASYVRVIQTGERKDGKPLAAATRANALHRVRLFFNFLERRGYLLCNPGVCIPVTAVGGSARQPIARADVDRLLNAPLPSMLLGQRDRAILETLYGTGIRASECVGLDLADVDLREGVLRVRRGKGLKDRFVPIPSKARPALEAYLRHSRPELVRGADQVAFFVSETGRRLQTPGLRFIVRTRARAAGIATNVFPHLLRHSYATHLVQGGADVRHVQALLGHESIETTAVYTRVALKDLESVIKRHPRRGRR
jgi:integrase/recombinase XerD